MRMASVVAGVLVVLGRGGIAGRRLVLICIHMMMIRWCI